MREIRPYGSVRGVRRKPYPYRDTILPVRSTVLVLARNRRQDHAFTARTLVVDSAPDAGFFEGCAVAPLLGTFRTRNVDETCLACGVFKNS